MKKAILSFLKMMFPVMVALVFVVSVSGCQKKEEGPMEKVGKEIDQTVEAAKDKVTDTAKDVKEGADKTVEAVKDTATEAGQAVKEGADKTKEAVKDAAK